MTTLLLLLILGVIVYAATRKPRSNASLSPTPLADRVAFLERRVVELQDAVDKLRRGEQPAPAPEPEPEPEPAAAPEPRPAPAPPPPVAAQPSPRPARAPSID